MTNRNTKVAKKKDPSPAGKTGVCVIRITLVSFKIKCLQYYKIGRQSDDAAHLVGATMQCINKSNIDKDRQNTWPAAKREKISLRAARATGYDVPEHRF